jgi:hypothetical protein
MGTASPKVSEGFSHPSPTEAVFFPVKDGAGSVGIVPVRVYCGRSVTAAPALLIEVGGQASFTETLLGILPAPEPPV